MPLHRWQASFILKHGRPYTPRPLPSKVKRGRAGLCFKNSAIAMKSDLFYCEGFAIHSDIPVHHAWLVTPDGFVVDRTWTGDPKRPNLGREYYGVAFKEIFVAMQAAKYHAIVPLLDDWQHDWPLWKNCPPTEAFLQPVPR
jgi:hypothetical protein